MSKSRVQEIIKEIFQLQDELREIALRFGWKKLPSNSLLVDLNSIT